MKGLNDVWVRDAFLHLNRMLLLAHYAEIYLKTSFVVQCIMFSPVKSAIPAPNVAYVRFVESCCCRAWL